MTIIKEEHNTYQDNRIYFIKTHKFLINTVLKSINPLSSGVLPYCYHNGEILFLMQRMKYDNISNCGWNDFGGKKNGNENIIEGASREFCEETSCLFFINKFMKDINLVNISDELKNPNKNLKKFINSLINRAKKYYSKNIINQCMYINSRDRYFTFLLKVDYIDAELIPDYEDVHVYNNDNKYERECKWFSYNELMEMENEKFHKRFYVPKFKFLISNYYEKSILSKN